jgi:hypothetical protein
MKISIALIAEAWTFGTAQLTEVDLMACRRAASLAVQ